MHWWRTDLSQGAVLSVLRGSSAHDEDGAYVELPFGPEVVLNMLEIVRELEGHGLALIDPDEDEPELVAANTLRVWCRAA